MLKIEKIEQSLAGVFEANQIIKHSIRLIGGKDPVLEICIARKEGEVDLDFCEVVSRQISDILDEIDDSDDAYMLDVCSYGAERELESAAEIAGSVGQYVHVELVNPTKGMDQVEGTLLSFESDQLVIEYMDKAVRKKTTIELTNVKFIRLAVKL